jgi:hypothetical protein
LKFNETVGEVGMITLDCIQADCGIHINYYNPVTAQTIWEVMFWFDKETEEGRAPFDEYFGFLRREQRAVLEAVSKFSQRTSNHLEARSMRTYLIRRMGVIWNFCRMFSEEICIGIGRPWSELVEDDRKICKALEELGSGRRKTESMPRSEDGRRRWRGDWQKHRNLSRSLVAQIDILNKISHQRIDIFWTGSNMHFPPLKSRHSEAQFMMNGVSIE